MKYLNKLPGSRRAAPGLEWVLLKKLPVVLLGGTLIPACVSAAIRFYPQEGTAAEIHKFLTSVDIMSIAVVVAVWMAVFVVAIGCLVVVLMKGPGYAADAYQLVDSDAPRANNTRYD